MGPFADDLAKTLDETGLPRKEREAAVADLVERCKESAELRERFLMRFVLLLSDDDPVIRGWACLGVVLCDDEGSHVERVARLLGDPSPGVRLQAAHALAPLEAEGLHERFVACLQDPDLLVRSTCAGALASAGDLRGVDVLLEAAGKRRTRLDALLALRPAARDASRRGPVEALATRLFRGVFTRRFDRVAAAALLAVTGNRDAGAFLVERARRGGMERPMAMELCGELRIDGGEAVVSSVAADPRDPLRGTALRALACYGGPEAQERCARALLDEAEDSDVRCDAAEGLLLLGSEDSRQSLEKARETVGDDRVRRVATACLELFGRPESELRLYLPLSGEELIS
ncbi:HEAT repeat domain-containing protein [Vulgatibacter incomptus]|uniref:HEAT repeat protein n=1 Tax=Vulgatibacter incomptus TaxID=1391653 RepID=A0A0K1PA84_9BACT|nr:HEAT repeat domain-containing protein [Vulgatibacter incomptus]AKU90448.1 HEAT repeat protein [Vulgatibacter incomptus]